MGAGVRLFTRQGLYATGIKQILDEADARFSSLYHHFPGGKDELAAEVIARSGTDYQRLVEDVWDSQPDVVNGVREVFEGAADVLEATDYADCLPDRHGRARSGGDQRGAAPGDGGRVRRLGGLRDDAPHRCRSPRRRRQDLGARVDRTSRGRLHSVPGHEEHRPDA